MNRRDNGFSTTFTPDFNSELVSERLTIDSVQGINREGQMCSGRTANAIGIGNILIVDQPLVGVTLKVEINNSGKGDDVVLTSSIGTHDVGLEINNR